MDNLPSSALPSIPAKRYFTIGEVGELCGVKPHVLRYWEQEFTQLRPMKRRGNRRYYQHHEVLMIRRIRDLLYDQGFTISGARNRLQEVGLAQALAEQEDGGAAMPAEEMLATSAAVVFSDATALTRPDALGSQETAAQQVQASAEGPAQMGAESLRQELLSIRDLLSL